jgi:hypothetical protein
MTSLSNTFPYWNYALITGIPYLATTCPAHGHLTQFQCSNDAGRFVDSLSYTFCNILNYPIRSTSYFVCPNIFQSTSFRNACNKLCYLAYVYNKFQINIKQIAKLLFYKGLSTNRPLIEQWERFSDCSLFANRSQWQRGLRYELSSLARTLEPWVRIPLEAWMSVCVCSVCR